MRGHRARYCGKKSAGQAQTGLLTPLWLRLGHNLRRASKLSQTGNQVCSPSASVDVQRGAYFYNTVPLNLAALGQGVREES